MFATLSTSFVFSLHPQGKYLARLLWRQKTWFLKHRGKREGSVLSIIQEGRRISKAFSVLEIDFPWFWRGGEDALAFIKLEYMWLVLVEAERRAGSCIEVLWLYTYNKPLQHMHASMWDPIYHIAKKMWAHEEQIASLKLCLETLN